MDITFVIPRTMCSRQLCLRIKALPPPCNFDRMKLISNSIQSSITVPKAQKIQISQEQIQVIIYLFIYKVNGTSHININKINTNLSVKKFSTLDHGFCIAPTQLQKDKNYIWLSWVGVGGGGVGLGVVGWGVLEMGWGWGWWGGVGVGIRVGSGGCRCVIRWRMHMARGVQMWPCSCACVCKTIDSIMTRNLH